MDVIPVIDLKGGHVVHAREGRRDEYRPIITPLSPTSAPEDVIAGLLHLFPFKRLYVADLDAIERRGDHIATLATVADAYPELDVWVDNGVSESGFVERWLASNRGRIVIGSESQQSPELLRALHGNPRVVLSLDFRGAAFQGPSAILQDAALWPDRVIIMTLARVGAALGPDLERIRSIASRAGARRIYAAGGVRNIQDLRAAADAGAVGALVSTALHQGALTPADLREIAPALTPLPNPFSQEGENGCFT